MSGVIGGKAATASEGDELLTFDFSDEDAGGGRAFGLGSEAVGGALDALMQLEDPRGADAGGLRRAGC